jgi:FlaA1/EpsC-like NDP-sugar epimerase
MKNSFLQFLTQKAINLSRGNKISVAIFLDIVICIIATWIALSISLGELTTINWQFAIPTLVSIFIAIPIFLSWGVYRTIFRYVNSDMLQNITKATIAYALLYSIVFVAISIQNIPRSIGLTQSMIMFLLIAASRWLVKTWLNQYSSVKVNEKVKKEVIIYGAGGSGRQLAANLIHNDEFKFLFFIDDNKNLWGGTIDGYSVKSPSSVTSLTKLEKQKELWLAMTKLSPTKKNKLINDLFRLGLHVRTLPSFSDLTNNRVSLSDVRELNINELVGREPVKPNINLLKKCIFKKTVLITGAGGSIGSEICRQILAHNPQHMLLAENSEVALYNIQNELSTVIEENSIKTILVPLLINIQDTTNLDHIFETWKPYTVYHAAAYKHVPMVELNVVAGVANNVIGTLRCANIAMKYNVKHFVLVSTDKAVRPTNVMGASKRLAEMTLQLLNNDPKNNRTCFCMVRFGNVLGSSGSVVPLFRKQIEAGGPVTLTDENVTRYFMTTTEAAQLVLQAGSMSKGGEVFVLDMGKPLRILDVAKNMIETAGFQIKDEKKPWGDIEIKIIGLRPGEKLYEELLIGNNPKSTTHPRILQENETFIIKKDFDKLIKELHRFLKENNVKKIIKLLETNVSGYKPSKNVNQISGFINSKHNK